MEELLLEDPKKTILEEIEDLVWKHDLSYIEAIVEYCEIKELDIELVGKILKADSKFEAEIRLEAEGLNCIPKTSRLPF